MNSKQPTMDVLFRTGRPLTGLYAFLLTLVSFKFINWDYWYIGVGVGILFALITMSIMTFNDIIDAENDRRKLKLLASEHKSALVRFWCLGVTMIFAGLAVLMTYSMSLLLFCIVVWVVGLGYSFIPRWYITQNVIVALCSGSPALCAMVYAGTLDLHSIATFGLFSTLIWLNECYKDSEDQLTDYGYKRTLPTELGWKRSWLLLVSALQMVAAVFFWHPNWYLQWIAVFLLPTLARDQVLARDARKYVRRPLNTMRQVIVVTGVLLYIT